MERQASTSRQGRWDRLPRPRVGLSEDLELIYPSAAADLLDVSRKTIWRLCERGDLGYYRVGRRIKISIAHLRRYLESRGTDVMFG